VIVVALLLQLQSSGPVDVAGRVMRVQGNDSMVAPGARVVLHRVGREVQGVLDSTIATRDGQFRFRVRPDSGDVLLVSARWHGVEYFAPPVVPGSETLVAVTDTSSRAPVQVAARHIIVGGPASDGARDVIDLIVLRNAGTLTRSGRDSLSGTWSMALPPLVANLRLGDADFARDAFDIHDDSLRLFAPIPPGDRQLFLQYQLAPGARSLDVPLGTDTDTISVLAEEDGLALPDAMARQGFEEMQGRRFARWSGSGNIGTLRIAFPNERELPGWVLPLLIAVLAVPLLWATRRAVARPRSETGGRRSESALDPPSADL
jgi:hypothetical protein